jgi:hypothetical protein
VGNITAPPAASLAASSGAFNTNSELLERDSDMGSGIDPDIGLDIEAGIDSDIGSGIEPSIESDFGPDI